MGDSDAADKLGFETQLKMAVNRYVNLGLTVHVMRAPDGADFNDALRHPERYADSIININKAA